MAPTETLGALKARKLADLWVVLGIAAQEPESELRAWWQGVIHGRLLELQAFGVLSEQEGEAVAQEVRRVMDAQGPAANDDFL